MVNGVVNLYFESNPQNGWVNIATFHPTWTDAPRLSIGGSVGPSGFTQFTANSVTVSSTPIPGAIFLFAPGLLGLVGIRRWAKK